MEWFLMVVFMQQGTPGITPRVEKCCAAGRHFMKCVRNFVWKTKVKATARITRLHSRTMSRNLQISGSVQTRVFVGSLVNGCMDT